MKKEKQVKENKKIKRSRHSLKRQITSVFIAIMVLTIGLLWLVNNFFLEKIYMKNKETKLLNVYSLMETEATSGDITSDEFGLVLQRNSAMNAVSLIILNSNLETVKVYSNEPQDELIRELNVNLTGHITMKSIIEENDNYIMVESFESRTKLDYIEMWGVLSDGSFFLLRTAVESIRQSAALASQVLLGIGIVAIIISGLFIYFFTNKFSKPILELAEISEKMSQMDFETKYTGKDKTEIGILGNSINKMSENLESTISELKSANIELRRDNDEKTKLDEMRKDFISSVSHELKTPIALIQGYAEGLKEEVNEAEERDYYCDVIMDEASKMNTMVKKILTLNQLESGGDVLQIDHFDVALLIRNYVQSSDILLKQKNISATVNGPETCFVWADEFKIEEVFMNFFSNAINHCESDTKPEIVVNMEKEDDRVKVSVFNTGNQIPEESIEHLWEKFYKVDKARSRQYGGSGVGLSIVKAIMEAHGCEYGVYNNENGVTFWFTLDSSQK